MKRSVYTWFDGHWIEECSTVLGSTTRNAERYSDLRCVSPGRFDVSGAAAKGTRTCNGKPVMRARV